MEKPFFNCEINSCLHNYHLCKTQFWLEIQSAVALACSSYSSNSSGGFSRGVTRAGHGTRKPTDTVIEKTADMWAFAAHWTTLDVKAVS